MPGSAQDRELHRHGGRVHSHPHQGPHRHFAAPSRSRPPAGMQPVPAPASRVGPARGDAGRAEDSPRPADHHGEHGHDHHGEHGHSHGLVHDSIKRSRAGVRAVALSLTVLGLAAVAQTVVFLASGSVALLADLIHNYGDALTAVPLSIAFALGSARAERGAGLAVVATIFVSACVAGVEAVQRLVHPMAPSHLGVLAAAGVIGFGGNLLASRIRLGAGRRLDSAALVADGHHARADAYVSLGVVASAVAVAVGIPLGDPLIGLAITVVILRVSWQSWTVVAGGGRHPAGGDGRSGL